MLPQHLGWVFTLSKGDKGQQAVIQGFSLYLLFAIAVWVMVAHAALIHFSH